MKKLLKIASTDCLQSLLPIIMWYAVGIVYKDTDYFNTFTLTYYYQFVYMIIYQLIIVGAIKYENKHNLNNNDNSYSAMILSVITFTLLVILIILNTTDIFSIMNIEYKYTNVYVFSILCLDLDLIVCGICKVKQYKNDNKAAFKITLQYYLSRIGIIVLIKLLIEDEITAILVTLLIIIIYIALLCKKELRIKHFKISCLRGIKYQISGSISSIAMFIIYFFGVGKVVDHSAAFLISYNICAMCTDTQWDILYSAIDTNTSMHICNNTFEKNKLKIIKNSVMYSILLMVTSLTMILINKCFTDFNIEYAITMFIIECITFPLYGIKYTYESWLMLKYHGKCLVIIPIFCYIGRLYISFKVQSMYALSIGVLYSAIVSFILVILLYNIKRKSMKC